MREVLGILLAVVVVGVFLGSVATLRRLDEPTRGWYDVVSSRLLYGVPWGTLVVMAFVTVVYLFVQDGIANPSDPVSIPYRAWSYFSPLGMATASFSHATLGHFTGNMIGTVLIAPLAEYVWGHYPEARERTGTSLWTTPWIRAVVIFPLAVVGIGLVTSLFALGPVIGFSGLVFAFAGFAIVRYPITTLFATTLVQSALSTTVQALQNPIFVYVAQPSPPTPPSWANVAIQGHALGFIIGLILGIILIERRGIRVNPIRVWIALVLYAFSKGLWQIYWFGEGNSFLLFRGPGVAIVLALALVITLAVGASRNPTFPQPIDGWLASVFDENESTAAANTQKPRRLLELAAAGGRPGGDSTVDRFDRITAVASGARSRAIEPLSPRSRRGSAFLVVIVLLALIAGMAVPTNLFVLQDPSHDDRPTVTVEDYTVEYADSAENQLVSGIGIEAIEGDAGLRSSGVIVSSEQRNLWVEAVSADQLEFSGEESVALGSPGWRETVTAERTGWELLGNETVYQVTLSHDNESQLAYESNGSFTDTTIEHRSIGIVPQDGTFHLTVESNETLESTALPDANESVTLDGITFEHDEDTIVAIANGTEINVATRETYD